MKFKVGDEVVILPGNNVDVHYIGKLVRIISINDPKYVAKYNIYGLQRDIFSMMVIDSNESILSLGGLNIKKVKDLSKKDWVNLLKHRLTK